MLKVSVPHHASKTKSNPKSAEKQAPTARPSQSSPLSPLVDRRPEAAELRSLIEAIPNSPFIVAQRESLRQAFGPALTSSKEKNAPPAQRPSEPKAATRRGSLPGDLQTGIEALSGISMEDVRVHYGSSQPAQLQALAYAQGSDIYLGPGQEQHLPHEAWHVVQQRQGRVSATTQLMGMGINDDAGLEAEAETMGNRAMTMATDAPVQGLSAARLAQKSEGEAAPRTGAVGTADLGALKPSGSAAPIQAKAAIVSGAGKKAYPYQTWEKLEPFIEQQGLEPMRYEDYELARVYMEMSSLDYGEINIDDPNHLAQFYFNLRKQLSRFTRVGAHGSDSIGLQEGLAEIDANAAKEWSSSRRQKLGTEHYTTAFLGDGASIAYAITAMGSGLDQARSVVIGPGSQPWREDRGPGVVAHPTHQITPKRRYTSRTGVDDIWQERGSFSDEVAGVIEGMQHITGTVTEVSRWGGMYKIMIAGRDQPVYADKVVAGMGVGGHKVPEGTDLAHVATRGQEVGPDKRIMSMDVFTQIAGNLWKDDAGKLQNSADGEDKPKDGITVVLSGANGGIDVAYDALRRGFKVRFIVSSGANFLPGFPNYAAYAPYIRGALKALDKAKKDLAQNANLDPNVRSEKLKRVDQKIAEVKKAAEEAGFDPDKNLWNNDLIDNLYNGQDKSVAKGYQSASKRNLEAVYFGRAQKPEATDHSVSAVVKDPFTEEDQVVQGDIFVYAIGQDTKKDINPVFKALEKLRADLVPLMDIDKRFSDEGEAMLGLSTADRSLTIVGATAFRYAPNVELHANRDRHDHPATAAMAFLAKRLDRERRALNLAKLAADERKAAHDVSFAYYMYLRAVERNDATGMETHKGEFKNALEVCIDYFKRNPLPPERQPLLEQFLQTANRAKLTLGENADATMATIGASGPVVSSLPGNVLINDQLTPTRSQIEASTGFVPLDIGMAANFTTDDRTALALHISAKYGTLADYQGGRYVEALAAMIIQNRKKSKVAPLTIYGETQASELYKVLASEKLPVPPNSAAFQAHWSEQLQQANQAVKDHLSQ